MDEYKEIRILLERWYAGDTSPDDESQLMAFFRDAGELPPDLETDRQLFSALDSAAMENVELPADVSERIDAAVVREMNAGSRKSLRRPKTWLYISVSIAAMFLVLFVAYRFMATGNEQTPTPNLTENYNDSHIPADRDTLNLNICKSGIARADVHEKVPRKIPGHKASCKNSVSQLLKVQEQNSQYDSIPNSIDESWISAEERARLEASNYRIVENENEADAIYCSVMMRMDGRIQAEHVAIEMIDADIDANF